MKKIIPPAPVVGEKDASGAYILPAKPSPLPPFKLGEFLFDKQLKFVEDPRPFKTAVCSRRAGKTVACAAHLIYTALETPGINCLYITLRRNNAEKLVWPELLSINRNYGLGGKANHVKLTMTFPNGSVIYLSGAKDQGEIEHFRGMAFKLAYIDECQSFRPYIRELIDDVIAPSLMDYNGSLVLIGTPGPIPAGFFAEVSGAVKGKESQADAWSHHHWTFFDNPHIAIKSKRTHQQMLDRELKRRGVDINDPSIQREWFGRWVLDSDSLLLHFNRTLNHIDSLPELPKPHKYNYIMGIDLGYMDADAIAVLAWSEQSPITYLVEEKVVKKQGLTELVEQIQEIRTRYDISKMVIDEGGLGKKLAEEMRRRHQIPVQAADKARKMESIAFFNDALRTGRFKAHRDSQFAQETFLVEIDRAKSTPDRIKVSDKYHSDIIDAVLYAFKESPSFCYEPPAKKAAKGTKEWADEQSAAMWEAAVDHFEEQAEWEKRINGES